MKIRSNNDRQRLTEPGGNPGFVLFVNIIVFNVSLVHKQFNFVNTGGVSIVFNYYEVSKTFKFKEIR